MTDIAQAATDKVIDAVDGTISAALGLLDAAVNAAAGTAGQTVDIGHQTADAALAEAAELQGRLMTLLREAAKAVTAPLP